MPQQESLYPWEFPGESWKRLHTDFSELSLTTIVVDSFSHWLEVFCIPQNHLSSHHYQSEQIVTDNATTFTSDEFQTFVEKNRILHITSAPGQLLRNWTTPNCTTGQHLTDCFLRRHFWTKLEFLKTKTKETMCKKEHQQKYHNDCSAAEHFYMYLCRTMEGYNWIPGIVVRWTDLVSYEVRDQDTEIIHRLILKVLHHKEDSLWMVLALMDPLDNQGSTVYTLSRI